MDERFVSVSEFIPDVLLDMRYYSTFNFMGERVDGYEAPCAILTREAAEALKKASDEFVSMGYRIRIYDAYRPKTATEHFAKWKENDDTKMKEWFYPDLSKDEVFEMGYIAVVSSHTRGSTVDISLFDVATGKDLDMGSMFDYFAPISDPDYDGPELTEEHIRNRKLLQEVMVRNGFRPFPSEWWHFTLENEPYPDTYFDFPVRIE